MLSWISFTLYNLIWGILNFTGNGASSISLVNGCSTCFLSFFNSTSRLADPVLALEPSDSHFLYWHSEFNLWHKFYLVSSTYRRSLGWSIWLAWVSALLANLVRLLFWQTRCKPLVLSCRVSCVHSAAFLPPMEADLGLFYIPGSLYTGEPWLYSTLDQLLVTHRGGHRIKFGFN